MCSCSAVEPRFSPLPWPLFSALSLINNLANLLFLKLRFDLKKKKYQVTVLDPWKQNKWSLLTSVSAIICNIHTTTWPKSSICQGLENLKKCRGRIPLIFVTEAPEHIPLWRESRFSSREMRSHEGPSRSNPLRRWAVEDTQPTEADDSWLQFEWKSATNPQGRSMSTHGQGHGPVSKRTQNKAVRAVSYFQDLTIKYSLPFLLTCFSKYSHYLQIWLSK